MTHTCPFDAAAHDEITDTEAVGLFDKGVCPLCIHDLAGPDICIECGHGYQVVLARYGYTGPLPILQIIPLED